jgi:hypothetical protein
MKTVGSRAQVFHKNAAKTSGGLTKSDLKKNKGGEIVSKKNSARAKRKESPLLKLWRKSVSHVYQKPKYAGRFIPIKKGSTFYNDIKKEYAKRLEKAGLGKKTVKKTKK